MEDETMLLALELIGGTLLAVFAVCRFFHLANAPSRRRKMEKEEA